MTPKWQRIIEHALTKEAAQSNVYQLASLDKSNGVLRPRVRSVAHRDLIAPGGAERPLLVTTTDTRSHKVHEIAENAHVEIVWWLQSTQEQLRLSGMMHILPAANFKVLASDASFLPQRDQAEIEQAARHAYQLFPRESLARDFDWDAYRVKQFNKLSGTTRAMWHRPVPGIPLKLVGGHEAARKWLVSIPALDDPKATDSEKKYAEDALNNFALVIVEPVEVDYVNLAATPNERIKFTRNVQGRWEEEEEVP